MQDKEGKIRDAAAQLDQLKAADSDAGRAVNLINSGRIQLAPIITHRFPIEKLKDAILMQMSSESLKVLVEGTCN